MTITRRTFLAAGSAAGLALAVSRSAPAQLAGPTQRDMQRADELLRQMTIEEKTMQLSCGVCCRMQTAHSLWLLGYPDQAVVSIQAALALAQQLAHPLSLTMALRWASVLHHLRREAPLTQVRAEVAITMATDQGFPQLVAAAMPLRGWALALQGQVEEGIAQIRQGLAAFRAMGATRDRLEHLAMLAEASIQVGETTEGLMTLAEALATLDQSDMRLWEAELYRLRGELLLQQTATRAEEAAVCFERALVVSRRQQARSWELRTAMSLARLWQRQGKRTEARELLTPIYGWFTEGFDTADLQVAKVLLDALV
jgi:predicted ATPase